jgi:alkylated DNA repair dioxygenase AlkB
VFVEALSWQGSLFACGPPCVDASFAGVERLWLDDDSWVDLAPAWLHGADALLARLVERIEWRQRKVTMWGQRLDEPRLTAWWTIEGPADLPDASLVDAWTSLSARYERQLDSLGANLYRDGRDSVAWHSDRVGRTSVDPIVAIVSLGEPRPFGLRPKGGGPAHTILPGGGDLLVMGGRCQHDWEHGVSKVAVAGPRLSLMFRHGGERPDGDER